MTENTKWCFIKEKVNNGEDNYVVSRIVERKENGDIEVENFSSYDKSLLRHSGFETVSESDIEMWVGFSEPLDMTLEVSKTFLLQDKPVDEVKIIIYKSKDDKTKLVLMTFEYGYIVVEVNDNKVVGTICSGITLIDTLNKYITFMDKYNELKSKEEAKNESGETEE